MRRNFKGCLKFLVLTILTIVATIFVFRLVRHPSLKNKDLRKVYGPEPNAWLAQVS